MEIAVNHSELEREVWTFAFTGYGARIRFFLTGYSKQSRPSKRHKFKIVGNYYDLYNKRWAKLTLEDVPEPPQEEVIKAATDNIKFTRHPQDNTPLFSKKD